MICRLFAIMKIFSFNYAKLKASFRGIAIAPKVVHGLQEGGETK